MQRALASLDHWQGTSWERDGLAEAKGTPECEVRLDRVEVNAAEIATEQIPDIPGFLKIDDHFLNRKDPKDFLPYRRIANYESEGSIQQMDILYEPTCQWISPFKVTLIPRDVTGLQPPDALSTF